MALIDELAGCWPPAAATSAAPAAPSSVDGYRRASLAGTRPIAACALDGPPALHGVALAAAPDGTLRTVPLVR
ncbi:MAG: hypothetical protein ACKOTZ_13675, partial [Chloroflexota bacterium]